MFICPKLTFLHNNILPIETLTGFWRPSKMILKFIGINKYMKTARTISKRKRKEWKLALPDAIRKLHGEKGLSRCAGSRLLCLPLHPMHRTVRGQSINVIVNE